MSKKKGNTRLPYGLCKKYGIRILDGWRPRDCWAALEEKLHKTQFQIYGELSREELEDIAKMQIWDKKDKSIELTSAVFDKISTVKKQLEKKQNVIIEINLYNKVYWVRLYARDYNYEYDIIKEIKIDD
jgi:hypothetical protein